MMEAIKFDYSMKNILVTTEIIYLLKLIEKIEMVIKRMRWKVIYCDMKGNSIETKTYWLKSQKTPPPINESAAFAKFTWPAFRSPAFYLTFKNLK